MNCRAAIRYGAMAPRWRHLQPLSALHRPHSRLPQTVSPKCFT